VRELAKAAYFLQGVNRRFSREWFAIMQGCEATAAPRFSPLAGAGVLE